MNDIEKHIMDEYYEENTLLCIPVFIYPDWLFQFISIQVIEGISIRKILPNEVDKIDEAFEHNDLKSYTSPNLTHLICIDRPSYLSSVKERIKQSGSDLPEFIHIENHAIVKHVLLSIFLASPIGFQVDAGGGIKIKNVTGEQKYQSAGWVKGWLYKVSDTNQHAIVSCGLREKILNPHEVQELARLLDPYFRAGIWWQDRMAAALAHLLDAICCNSITLTYLSLIFALEALVNSSKNEITHQICERVAILCGNTKEEKTEIFLRVKKLYNTRSTLVHGQAHKMKGRVTWDSLLVSPKSSVVPIEELKDLIKITVLTIKSVLRNADLINIYESSRDEGKVSKKITDYFINRLF